MKYDYEYRIREDKLNNGKTYFTPEFKKTSDIQFQSLQILNKVIENLTTYNVAFECIDKHRENLIVEQIFHPIKFENTKQLEPENILTDIILTDIILAEIILAEISADIDCSDVLNLLNIHNEKPRVLYGEYLSEKESNIFHISLDNVSHIISNLRFEYPLIIGDINFLNTENGKKAYNALKNGSQIKMRYNTIDSKIVEIYTWDIIKN